MLVDSGVVLRPVLMSTLMASVDGHVDEHGRGLVEVIGDWIIGLDPLERGLRLIRCQPLLDSPPV